ncbi:MAG TPA: crossover junction endodeoxyribonuclease RuvC [Candidatus Eremiobacteraeota bacterium]|nr:MAG: Crossover junction endodeoxyribonuclease RuvC [bacterium ADurb.Bin363]HPZ07527.1 crossover junction endodeoxyribonuclease RuvC [Candidatus Eremiobacteraeota bacterium]
MVMGVDPGLITTGYGILEVKGEKVILLEGGVVKTDSGKELSLRLEQIFNGISSVLDEFHPEVVAVEKLYSHYKHPRTAIMMGHARGVIYLAASLRKIPVVSYGATEIKKSITGRGRASKEQVQYMMARELGLSGLPKPYDVSDALAIALTHLNMRKKYVI